MSWQTFSYTLGNYLFKNSTTNFRVKMVSILALGCTLIFSFTTILKNIIFIYILKIETQELKNKNPVKCFLTVEEP